MSATMEKCRQVHRQAERVLPGAQLWQNGRQTERVGRKSLPIIAGADMAMDSHSQHPDERHSDHHQYQVPKPSIDLECIILQVSFRAVVASSRSSLHPDSSSTAESLRCILPSNAALESIGQPQTHCTASVRSKL